MFTLISFDGWPVAMRGIGRCHHCFRVNKQFKLTTSEKLFLNVQYLQTR